MGSALVGMAPSASDDEPALILELVERIALLNDGARRGDGVGVLIVRGRLLRHLPAPASEGQAPSIVFDFSLDDGTTFWSCPPFEVGLVCANGSITLLRFESAAAATRERFAVRLGLPPPSELASTEDSASGAQERNERAQVESDEMLSVAHSAASAIQSGGVCAANGIQSAAAALSQGMTHALENLQLNVQPAEVEATVTPAMANAVATARTVAEVAKQFTGLVGAGVVSVASAVGSAAAEHMSSDKPDTPTVAALKVVGAASVTALSSIGDALDESSVLVASKGAAVTAAAVGHVYGEEAGRCSGVGLAAVGEAALAARNASHLGRRGIAKVAAKSAATAAVKTAVNAGEEEVPAEAEAASTSASAADLGFEEVAVDGELTEEEKRRLSGGPQVALAPPAQSPSCLPGPRADGELQPISAEVRRVPADEPPPVPKPAAPPNVRWAAID